MIAWAAESAAMMIIINTDLMIKPIAHFMLDLLLICCRIDSVRYLQRHPGPILIGIDIMISKE